jgi:hypothetical protein
VINICIHLGVGEFSESLATEERLKDGLPLGVLIWAGHAHKESTQQTVVIGAFLEVWAFVMRKTRLVVIAVKLVRADANDRA